MRCISSFCCLYDVICVLKALVIDMEIETAEVIYLHAYGYDYEEPEFPSSKYISDDISISKEEHNLYMKNLRDAKNRQILDIEEYIKELKRNLNVANSNLMKIDETHCTKEAWDYISNAIEFTE